MTEKLVFVLYADELKSQFNMWPENMNLAVKYDSESNQTPFLLFRKEETKSQLVKFAGDFPIVPEYGDHPTTRIKFGLETRLMDLVTSEENLPNLAGEYSENFQILLDSKKIKPSLDDDFGDIEKPKMVTDLSEADLRILEEEIELSKENTLTAIHNTNVDEDHEDSGISIEVSKKSKNITSYSNTVSDADDFSTRKKQNSYDYGYPDTRGAPFGFVKDKDLKSNVIKVKREKGKIHFVFEGKSKVKFNLNSEKFYRPDGLSMLIQNAFEDYPNKQTVEELSLTDRIMKRIPNNWANIPFSEHEEGIVRLQKFKRKETKQKTKASVKINLSSISAIVGAVIAIGLSTHLYRSSSSY